MTLKQLVTARRWCAGLTLTCLLQAAEPSTGTLAILRLKITAGDGVHRAGERAKLPLTVEVTDETGRPVAGAAVSFQLPAEGPSGEFQGGLRSELSTTNATGQAIAQATRWSPQTGPVQVRITAVKDGVRAGTFAQLYLVNNVPARSASRSHGRWTTWAILAAGVAGSGAALALRGGSRTTSATAAAAAAPALSIGAPAITVGAPR